MQKVNRLIPYGLEVVLKNNDLTFNSKEGELSGDTLQLFKGSFIQIKEVLNSYFVHSAKIYPASYNQKALWFHQEMNPDNCSYNIAFVLKIKGSVPANEIRQSLEALADRHILLRSCFLELNHTEIPLCLLALDGSKPLLEEIKIGNLEDSEVKEKIYEKYRIPFNLRTDKLLKTYVFSNDNFTYVFFNIHHIISDAWALKIFIKEFLDNLNKGFNGSDYDILTSDFDFDTYTYKQYDYISGAEGYSDLVYWVNKFKNRDIELKLPVDNNRGPVYRFNGATRNFQIKDDLFKGILRLAADDGVFPNHIIYSLFDLFLARISGQDNFNIGITVANREIEGSKNVFGYLLNTLPLENAANRGKSFRKIVEENSENFDEIAKHQSIPFSRVIEEMNFKRDLSRPLLFQVLYNFMNRYNLGYLHHFINPVENQFKRFGNFEIASLKLNDQEGQFDLTFEIIHYNERFECYFKYNTELFTPETIDRFISQFLDLAEVVIKNPDSDDIFALTEETEEKQVVNITGTYTVEPLLPALEFWFSKLKIKAEINFPGYNQAFSQLLDPNSDFNSASNAVNILMIRIEDWLKDGSGEGGEANLEAKLYEFIDALHTGLQNNSENRLFVLLSPPSERVLADDNLRKRINDAEDKIAENRSDRLIIIDSAHLVEQYDTYDYYEEMGEDVGHMPYTDEFYVSAATQIVRHIFNQSMLPFKAIAVDCDNTLWQGVVGEDGVDGIVLGDSELALQKFLVEQNEKGVLICLCSKNVEEDVLAVFNTRKDMVLTMDHIAFHRINWNLKSQNLVSLAEEINIGIDSFIFIDDNPAECQEVNSSLPEVLTLELPSGSFNTFRFMNSWIFDKNKVTEEDRKRTQSYKAEATRVKFQSTLSSYKDFIEGLNLKIEIEPVQEDKISRVSQLTFRTNQFNFTTKRRSEAEISELIASGTHLCYQVHVSDRFGEYGLVGVAILEKGERFILDTFLLSCRVLGKGVEHKIFSYLGKILSDNGKEVLDVPYIETAKNIPAHLFLEANFLDYKINQESLEVFSIPEEILSAFTFDPVSVKKEPENHGKKEKKKAAQAPATGERNSLLLDVFNNLYSVQLINEKLRIKKSSGKTAEQGKGGSLIKTLSEVWKEFLHLDNIDPDANFFEIGGHSVLIPQIVIRLKRQYDIDLKIVDVFQYPSVRELASYLGGSTDNGEDDFLDLHIGRGTKSSDIAIIGLAGRFPEAHDIDEFWQNIISGKECITFFSREELESAGLHKELLNNPNYVFANGIVPDADKFDSFFFGVPPKEADILDPQHKMFLEVCYEALENSGYLQEIPKHHIGLFGGAGMHSYIVKNLAQHPDLINSIGEFQTVIGNNSDHMVTRTSYKLNLKGPSVDVQSACSTSLVAVHMACQSLLNDDCSIAMAGAAFLPIPYNLGYMYESGGIFSPDGHCRPFDKEANGTLFGSGAGVVVLKRLEDALKDNDTIWAIIKGSAINNDGAQRVGYMAPSSQGQYEVILKALRKTGIDPSTISYIEAHGTGTKMGDPIEVSALTQAYNRYTDKKQYCALGSVKGNVGHLDAAAGITGLIKTALMLKNRKLVPVVNYTSENPDLNLADSPFFINNSYRDWDSEGAHPRRAAISSFGMGGTNAHCILEEAPEKGLANSLENKHFLPISAKKSTALGKLKENLLDYLEDGSDLVSDIAFTLQQGRINYKFRELLYIEESAEEKSRAQSLFSGQQKYSKPEIVFMFTGQGSQFQGMFRDLYEHYEIFRSVIDDAHAYLEKEFNFDLKVYILNQEVPETIESVNSTAVAQPLLFTVQYGLAVLLRSFGVNPDAVTGHSIGEYAAACLSGVFSFKTALKLVYLRGKYMQEQKAGAMLSVQLPAEKLSALTNEKVSISLINAPEYCVVSGDFPDIDAFEEQMNNDYPDVHTTRLKTSHAFHSYMMEPALDLFRDAFKDVVFGKNAIPFISNMSGTWASEEELSGADYWVNHIVSKVNFSDGIKTLMDNEETIFIEIGPGNSLAILLSQFNIEGKSPFVISSGRHARLKLSDKDFFLKSLGEIWVSGGRINWEVFYKGEKRRRIALPSYPFERNRHWIEPVYEIYGVSRPEMILSGLSESEKTDEESKLENQNKPISAHLHSRPDLENEFRAPENEIESAVQKIWEDLLGIGGIGIEDDFFMLGGHSLLASQVLNHIKDYFITDLTINDFFSYSTIKQIAVLLKKKEGPSEEEIIKELDYSGPLPVSPSQERMWIINRILDNNPSYNIPFSYRISGMLDEEVFRKSLSLLFERHIILHTVFRYKDGNPVAFLNKQDQLEIQHLDFSQYVGSEQEKHIQKFIEQESRKQFNIEQGPLYRLFLVRISPDDVLFNFTVHHLVFDGWSWGVFLEELAVIYNHLVKGLPNPLSPIIFNYFQYSYKSRQTNPREKYAEHIRYWTEKLKDYNSVLDFPFDFPRKELPSGEGGRIEFELDEEKSNLIKQFCKRENVTLYMFFLSLYGVLLNRYTGANDICIGSPVANRNESRHEKLIGLFINTIVLRLQINPKETFIHLLNEVKKVSVEAMNYQEIPFELLVEYLQVERSVNTNPIFQTMFAWQNAPRPPMNLEGTKSHRVHQEKGVASLDITLFGWEDEGLIKGEIQYNTDILKEDTIVRLYDNFMVLLNELLQQPEIPVNQVPVISEKDAALIRSINSTDRYFPRDKTIVHLFEDKVDAFKDKAALVFGEGKMTYQELNSKANRLAHYLMELGVGREVNVGILVDKSMEMLVGILAILKAGGTYVPIDPEYPEQRIRFLIQDSSCRLLLTQTRYKDLFSSEVQVLDLNDESGFHLSSSNPEILCQPNDVAAIIYTSGTTGVPKGSLIRHFSAIRLIYDPSYMKLEAEDRLLYTSAIVFDVTTFEIWSMLLNGGTLYIVEKESILKPEVIGAELKNNRITILHLTSALFTELASRKAEIFSDLKYLLVGGDVLSVPHINKVRRTFPALKLLNCYGPSENTTYSTIFEIEKECENNIPIGKPINNSTAYVFDKYMNHLPVGVFGEILVGGDGLSKAYLNRDDLNQTRFVLHPQTGERLYRTGDIGRFLPDGNLEFKGRTDNQIKIRGFRIELEEIESVINEIENVVECVVKPVEFDKHDIRLIAFIRVPASFNNSFSDISKILRNKLPLYMIPSGYVYLEDFPRTTNGKIDRKQLIYQFNSGDAAEIDSERDLTETEKQISNIWTEVLKVSNIGLTDNFFDVGGNSLLAISLVEKFEESFNMKISLRVFFDSPTIGGFAHYIEFIQDANSSQTKVQTPKSSNIIKGEL